MAHFENITLEKGMYSVPGKSFTQVLEQWEQLFLSVLHQILINCYCMPEEKKSVMI